MAVSDLGRGGANYNTANTSTRRQIEQNQSRISSDDDYRQAEIQRALRTIASREAAGEDTSAQQKYLTTNLGYKAPTATAPQASTPAASSALGATSAASRASNSSQGTELMDLMRQIATREATPFSYDRDSDPAYQTAVSRARSNIEQGNSAAQAEMNRRGILNSTITSDRMGEIASQEMGRVESEIAPQLEQAAYQRYLNDLQRQDQQLANVGSVASMYLSEDQRGIDNTNTRAGLTGYLPGGEEAQGLVNQLLTLKQQAEAPGITAADRSRLSNQADGVRAMLSQMGVDASAYGANVDFATASQTAPSIRTLAGQQLDLQRQGQSFNQGFSQEQFAYQQARDAISDQQWRAAFDQSAQQFGINYALNMLQENNQQAYREAQVALGWDDNDRQWVSLEQDRLRSTSPEYSGMTPTQILDAARQRFSKNTDDGRTVIPQDPVTKKKVYEFVGSMGLPLGQDDQVMMSLGLSRDDIDGFDKEIGMSSPGK
ncbi:hypothetical protein [Paenibacillus senegalimassiliensis]|uniref:hypothetical protein n=1 Tax=Paenibacillus senegalimassiliensis TaxID=1737426 RepID=UPI00073E3425|nr:hypothetical protein [Paenibacillus senegalimassiliensis]